MIFKVLSNLLLKDALKWILVLSNWLIVDVFKLLFSAVETINGECLELFLNAVESINHRRFHKKVSVLSNQLLNFMI